MTKKIIVVLLLATAVFAQAKKARVSPHDKSSVTLGGKDITIDYGRPYLKGRSVGKEVAPYGQVWRTGANEATKLTTPVNLKIGTLAVPAGSYSLYTLPTEKAWKLIVNKTADQWGTEYNQGTDFGRVDMKLSTAAAPVEQLTISFDKAGEKKATLKIAWGTTEVSVPVEVQ